MKSYTAFHRLRLVGKGWEIQSYLRDALRQTALNIRLSDYLDGQLDNGRPPVRTDSAEATPEPSRPQRKPQQRTQDRRVLPFPLK
ncbi:Z-ring formation inhibitor MciZ [Paenibacillus sp. P26]|nr:Z-ring formation inhibitor MciZ [Paenibacillus sp. P26]UUZ94344.1 Z-ring formation inhibitor MciZ [Paenibacillus sp. P25]